MENKNILFFLSDLMKIQSQELSTSDSLKLLEIAETPEKIFEYFERLHTKRKSSRTMQTHQGIPVALWVIKHHYSLGASFFTDDELSKTYDIKSSTHVKGMRRNTMEFFSRQISKESGIPEYQSYKALKKVLTEYFTETA